MQETGIGQEKRSSDLEKACAQNRSFSSRSWILRFGGFLRFLGMLQARPCSPSFPLRCPGLVRVDSPHVKSAGRPAVFDALERLFEAAPVGAALVQEGGEVHV